MSSFLTCPFSQLFNSSLEAAFPSSANSLIKPVVSIQMSQDSKYAFVELATEEMASAALQLHGMELCGRAMSIARPSGWVDAVTQQALALQAEETIKSKSIIAHTSTSTTQHIQHEASPAALADGIASSNVPAAAVDALKMSEIVCLANLVTDAELTDDDNYADVREDVADECSKCGEILDLRIPRFPTGVGEGGGVVDRGLAGKVFVRFASVAAAAAAVELMHGRMFDGRRVSAAYVEPSEFEAVPDGR